ncbi:hypothetical protein [Natronolimnohabitans innermongolicus]|nr:hypothetical protein [Natronolimnohabitans innermongolicus]
MKSFHDGLEALARVGDATDPSRPDGIAFRTVTDGLKMVSFEG